jgi:thiol-disulfide isomerase/thioredoxin|tara:strand:- start:1447 stop:1788 length:342 start_codon:yes stop_codon:yes gene_type:complete
MQNQYIHLKTDNLKTIVENEKKVIVMFGSRFCGWCRIILEKYLNSLASQNSDSIFVYIEAEDQMGRWIYPKSMGLLPKEPDQWPWWACFKNGKCIDTITTSAMWELNQWLDKQ